MARKVEIQIVADAKGAERAFASAKASAAGLTGAVGTLRVGFASLAKSVIVVDAVNKALDCELQRDQSSDQPEICPARTCQASCLNTHAAEHLDSRSAVSVKDARQATLADSGHALAREMVAAAPGLG